MVQSLSDLSVFGKSQIAHLKKSNFDPSKLELAESTSSETGHLLSVFNNYNKKASKTKRLRDQAYTHLKEAVDEIRDCGKYQFEGNKTRLKGYRSAYIRRHY